MATEDDEDAQHGAGARCARRRRVRRRELRVPCRGCTVLDDVNFHAPAGSTTALVGSSGGGKSTLIGLIMAFNRPRSGRVMVDGRDLAALKLRDYRAQLGVVLQDNFLFDGTDRPRTSRSPSRARRSDEVREAARIAHCDEFVRGFEKGYDTIVGERGVKLSGGQRQRVAIARAILADPQHPHSRRGDVEPRQRERGADPRRPAVTAAGPHDLRHRAPALDHRERRPDPGAGERQDRGARHAAGTAGPAAVGTSSCMRSSMGWRRTSSSIPGRTSRRSRKEAGVRT